MMLGPHGNVWIATDGGGINIYHQEEGTFSYISAHTVWGSDLPGNQVYSLYLDDQNRVWQVFMIRVWLSTIPSATALGILFQSRRYADLQRKIGDQRIRRFAGQDMGRHRRKRTVYVQPECAGQNLQA